MEADNGWQLFLFLVFFFNLTLFCSFCILCFFFNTVTSEKMEKSISGEIDSKFGQKFFSELVDQIIELQEPTDLLMGVNFDEEMQLPFLG